MTWMKLQRGNDWGVEYFYRPDRPKSPAGTYSRSSGVDFQDGVKIRVRWPDGSESTERVRRASRRATVHDHGHVYDVDFELAGIETSSRGISSWVPLDAVLIHEGDVPSPNKGDGK